MAAHKLAVLGDSDVALHDAGTHFHGGNVRLLRVLGELHARAAVTDGEVVRSKVHPGVIEALLQRILERPKFTKACLFGQAMVVVYTCICSAVAITLIKPCMGETRR